MSELALKTENVDRFFKLGKREVRALSNVNLEIKKGDFVSIMGPSGSGKTTLLNVLGCLDKPTKGSVYIDNEDVSKVPEKSLYKIRRHKIGFVFQTFNLMPWLDAAENVELPMEGVLSKDDRQKRARELLEMVGLSERIEHRPQKLSAGEQQRVAIARALANKPAIVLADEPTGNLDSKTKYEIINLLAKLNSEQGTTIIMVTHDNKMGLCASRMLFLNDGKLLTNEKQGSHLKLNCSNCGKEIQTNDTFCSGCGKKLPQLVVYRKSV
jgi:putative ABC transport system ATP-binding protein